MTSVLQCIGAGAVVPFVITDVTEQGRLNKTKQSQVLFFFCLFFGPQSEAKLLLMTYNQQRIKIYIS